MSYQPRELHGDILRAALRSLALLVAAVGAQACRSSPPPRQSAPAPPHATVLSRRQIVVDAECDGPARSVPQPTRDSLQARFARIRSDRARGPAIRDNYWHATLARELPGRFAGLYIGSPAPPYIGAIQDARRVVVLLADTTDVAGALAAMAPYFGPELTTRGMQFGDAVVRKSRWDFAQLLEWQHVLVPVVRAIMRGRPFASGITVFRNRVTFAVPDSTAVRLVEARFATLDLPCDLVRLELGGRVELR